MTTIKTFDEFEAWKKARELTREVYSITKQTSFSRDFGLRDQIRRASVSIMSNIAEGFERDGKNEFIQFLSLAKGSTGEVISHLCVAYDQKYISLDIFKRVKDKATEVGKLVGGLMNYLKKSTISGIKYKR